MISLKVLLTVAAIFSAVFAFSSNRTARVIFEEWKTRTQKEHPECLKSTGVKIEYVDQYWNDFKMANDEGFKCYLECVFASFRLANDDGSINKEELVQDLDKATSDMVDICNGKINKPLDKCELLYELVKCLLQLAFP